jgi:hypothetical protein
MVSDVAQSTCSWVRHCGMETQTPITQCREVGLSQSIPIARGSGGGTVVAGSGEETARGNSSTSWILPSSIPNSTQGGYGIVASGKARDFRVDVSFVYIFGLAFLFIAI